MAIIRSGSSSFELQIDSNNGARANLFDSAGIGLTSTLSGGKQALDVNIASGVTLSVNLDPTNDSVLVYGFDGAANQKIKTNSSGRLQVDVFSSALPSGASTEATLAALNAKFNSLGQKTMANSAPVVLASDQSAIPVSQFGTWTVSLNTSSIEIGTVDQGAPNTIGNAWPVKPTDGTNSQSYTGAGEAKVSVTQPLPAGTNNIGLVSAVQSGTWNITNISGTISLPSGAATETTLSAINAKLGTLGQKTMANSAPVVIASDQSAIPVSQSGTWNINNISGTISLPTGAATEATLSALNVKFANDYGASAGAIRVAAQIGNTTGAASFGAGTTGAQTLRVVLPTDQTSIPAAQSGTWNITNITGTVSLPTGAATEATLSALSAKFNSLGQKTMANSAPVVIASDQSAIPVSQSGTWNINNIAGTISLPTGAATEASLAKLTLAQGSTTSGESGPLVQGAVSTASPSYTNGQTNPISLTTAGALRIDGSAVTQPVSGTVTANQGGAPWSSNTTQIGGTAIATGNGVAGTGVQRVTIASDNTAFSVNAVQSGTWNINNISGTISLPTGAATETTLSALNAKFNSLGQKTMANSAPIVIASDQSAIPVSQSGTWNITNITGTVSLPTGAATESSLAKLTLTQGSTTSGQSGPLMQGAVTTAAPSYTTAQTSPLSLDTGGNLRVLGRASGTAGAAIPDRTTLVGGSDGTNLRSLSTDAAGNLAASADQTVSGNITALNGVVTLSNIHGVQTVLFQLLGTWTATIVAEGSMDGTNWTALSVSTGNGTFVSTGVTVNAIYRGVTVAGYTSYRLRASAFTSGTVNVIVNTSIGTAVVQAFNVQAANFNVQAAPVDGIKATYRAASVTGLAVAGAATDVFTITGSATKTIRIIKVSVAGTQTVAATNDIVFLKRSTANTAGTSTTRTAVPMDSNSAAATATVRTYTANPTLGTLVGNLMVTQMVIPVAGGGASTQSTQPLEWKFGDTGQAVVLRGTGEVFALNLNGQTITGSNFNLWIEWTEE